MYKIIGADGKEYGPATADQLREWIQAGRANAQTRAQDEGTTEWKPLGEYLELAPLLTQTIPSSSTPGRISIAPVLRTNPLAVTGLIMGILSLTCVCCCSGVPFNILGIIFSCIALAQINANPSAEGGRPLAIAGLILSILGLLLAIAFFIFGIAINGLSSTDFMQKLEKL
jgi:hypothetical protein